VRRLDSTRVLLPSPTASAAVPHSIGVQLQRVGPLPSRARSGAPSGGTHARRVDTRRVCGTRALTHDTSSDAD
jgi:hypothetical protein